MTQSKTQIDKAGRALAAGGEVTLEVIQLEDVFDEYRAAHLEPLSKTTLELQKWLHGYGGRYYIAQRLKRKPQIVRKLRRLSVRLTQLQDIGGCRIIVDTNKDVDKLLHFLKSQVEAQENFKLTKVTDYRGKGRDDTGYRAVHLLLSRDGRALELQVRSRIQHYWAESIERTSVIYGYHLKEKEGDPQVISYFKLLSDVFFEIESGREPAQQAKVQLDKLRVIAEGIISRSDKNRVMSSFVNEDIVKTLTETQGSAETLNNWVIVFDWNTGAFVTWDTVGRDAAEAVKKYIDYERQFTSENNFEVVMIGSSDIASVSQTHSHYFGIDKYEDILESLEESIIGFSKRLDIDVGARQILSILFRKKYWGTKMISQETVKNHYLKGLLTFESSLRVLKEKNLVHVDVNQGPISLNLKKKSEIEAYL